MDDWIRWFKKTINLKLNAAQNYYYYFFFKPNLSIYGNQTMSHSLFPLLNQMWHNPKTMSMLKYRCYGVSSHFFQMNILSLITSQLVDCS